MEHNEYEKFLLGYVTIGELPAIDSVSYVTIASRLCRGLITGFDWDSEIGEAVKEAIDAQGQDFRDNVKIGYLVYSSNLND